MKQRRFPPEAVAGVWRHVRRFDYECSLTKVRMEMDDITSPWFCVFDHVIPLEPTEIELVCALFNRIKTALAKNELRNIAGQLDDNHRKGKKIRKIKLRHWGHCVKMGMISAVPAKMAAVRIFPEAQPKWKGKHKKCRLCGKPVFSLQSKYCRRCSHFAYRLNLKKFPPEVKKAILAKVRAQGGFFCEFTGVELEMDDYTSPWYCVFHYLTPGDKTKVVLTCALFAEMKANLMIEEFWYYIRQVADHFRYGTKIRKRKPRYWNRLTPRQLRLKSLLD